MGQYVEFTEAQNRIYKKFSWRLFCSVYSWMLVVAISISVLVWTVSQPFQTNGSIPDVFIAIGLSASMIAGYFVAKAVFYRSSHKIISRWPNRFPIIIDETRESSWRVKPFLEWLVLNYVFGLLSLVVGVVGLIPAVLSGYIAMRMVVKKMFAGGILQFS